MIAFTYSSILFFTVIICFVASFDRRIQFNKHFGAFLQATTLVAIPFIAWDIWFTSAGVWWFNMDYTLGISVAGLPLEEWLFFICIPFSCVFTYYCIDKFYKLACLSPYNNLIVFISIITCSVVGLLYADKMYTLLTAIATIVTLIFLHFIVRAQWIGKASFVFSLLMLGFFPVNGLLTGTGLDTPIVNYNPQEFIGLRMLTIPIEDAVYGYMQFLLVLYFFKRFGHATAEGRSDILTQNVK